MQLLRLLFVLAIFALLPTLIGHFALPNLPGALIGLLIGLVIHIILLWWSPAIILKISGVYTYKKESYVSFHAVLTAICEDMHIPVPRVAITPSPQPNAFAVGRSSDDSTIVVTQGLLELVSEGESAAIVAQVLQYTQQQNFYITTITACYAAIITRIAQMGQFSVLSTKQEERGNSLSALLFFLLAPLASTILKFILTERTHLQADFEAAKVLKDPKYLAKSLEKVHLAVEHDIPLINPNPSLSALYVVHPIHQATLKALFDTHPPMSTRLSRLLNMTL
ncbi:hypothetical protein COW46_00185 [Candidatus Gracilibacteria bacterium CG17_big_fil_post_rev_8_21_14_2_50_48_13]|nr:MAG: hypothetical protein COW46_00185 [Candidatus Gracilibacteria bacterium CG17_big_fil_post_rev_8_21_14_2_50_48_13]